MVRDLPHKDGLILQLREVEPLRDGCELADLESLFPALRVALAEHTRWPGVLVWTPRGDRQFFELTFDVETNVWRLDWLFNQLATKQSWKDLKCLRRDYAAEHRSGELTEPRPLHIHHLSDIHLGTRFRRLGSLT